MEEDSREYDEDEEERDGDGEEEGDDGRQMLGFMFGNVDDSGGLDEEYLDQDAKEHLSALAQQLGPSFVDIELHAKRKKLAEGIGGEEHEDYDQKAEDAVDYEDIQEQYEGPEVQFAQQELQFYADAALAGPIKLADDDDNYDDEENDDESEQGKDDEVGGFDPKRPVEDDKAQDEEDCDSEQPQESLVKNVSEMEKDALYDRKVSMVHEQCLTSAVDMMASDEDEDDKEDWDQILGSQETSSSKEQKEELPKISLPVLCQEDGKTVLRFSELFGVREPYWIIGHRKGREKRGYARERRHRAEEDLEAMEDDEEGVLMSCSQQAVLTADSSETERDFESGSISDESQVENGVEALLYTRYSRTKQRNLAFTAAEPMKDGIVIYTSDTSETTRHIPEANFDLIHQLEWEDDILWDTSKRDELTSVHHHATCQLIEVDSENEQNHFSDVHSERLIMDQHVAGLRDHPVVVEPLCQSFNGIEDEKEAPKTLHHSQVLRLETRSFDIQTVEEARTKLLKRICNMTREVKENNREIASGDWLSSLSWGELEPHMPRVKVILDFMDPHMVFEDHTSEAINGQSLCFHAAAVVLAAGGTHGAGDIAAEGSVHAPLSLTRFNISNDKYYTNKKTHQQLKSNAKKRAIHGVKVMHSLPAIKLQSMKPKLSNKDLANFHRPKALWYPHHNEVAAKEQGKLAAVGRMQVIVKTLGGKGTKHVVDASETLDALKAKTAKKLGDVKPSEKTKVFYSGKELDDRFSFYQQQVLPNSVLHLVRTRIYPWPKAQRLPGENKPLRPPGAFKKKSELSVKDGHVALMEYCEERPLLLGNVGMGGRLYTYYRKRSPTDATAATLRAERGPWVGITLPLEPTEDSPFLGDIRPGDTQSSLETNMYRAPVFPHKLSTTDFLLVRSSKGKLSLRRIDSVHVVGQQEPHMEVLTPTSKSVQNYLGNRLMVYLYREFREKEKPDVITPHVRADDVISQFPTLTEGFIRKRLKHCADLQKIGGEMCWVMRRNFRIPSEEEMRRLVTPENVCTYESMQAGQHHLKRMGVHKLTQPSGLASAMNQLPDEAITIAAASHIERELQITPWNLSSNFVAATMQGRGSLERLEIVGAGDPSGRGLGFSYLRVATKPPNAGALVEKKAAAARGGGAVTGTDADLRRLSMEAAREVLLKFKVPEETIDKLTRWHRIAMVRKLSSEQAASGVKLGAAVLNKFARGQRMSFLQLQQQTREKCQDIWDKQVQSLSMPDGDDSGSDGEVGGDLDSFAGDLENLLEAEEGDQGGVKKGKREGIGGLGARRRKQIAQEEEDIEDEEAEAAELRRMLRADDEAEEEQKKKKSVSGRKEKKSEEVEIPFDLDHQSFDQKSATFTHPGHKFGDGQAGKKKKRILKRIIRTRKPDGSYSSKEILITDPKEVALYLAKKNASKVLHEKAGADKDDSQKRTIGRAPLSSKKLKSVASTTEMSAKGKVNRKFGRDALSLVCGACGQLGHMRTNKKCPLYNEEGGEHVAWQDSGAAAAAAAASAAAAVDGLLERQGTRITIKRKSISSTKFEEEPDPVDPPPAIITPSSKQEFPLPPTPVVKTPSLKMKIKLSSANQNPDSVTPAPSALVPPGENTEKNESGDPTGMWKTPRPVIKLKLSNQKQKEQGAKRLKVQDHVEAAWEDRGRGKQRVVHEEAEREREENERERQRERKERDETHYLDDSEFNPPSHPRDSNKFSFTNKVVKKKTKDGPESMLRKKRQREAEEYQLALEEELKREQEELERKEALQERPRKEQCKVGRERTQRQPIKEKDRRRELHRLREDEPWRAPKETVEVDRLSRDGVKRERDMILHKKNGHLNKLTRLVSGETERGQKGMKFRQPDLPPSLSCRRTPEFGSAPKRLRKKGGEVDLCNILEDVVETLKNADCAYLFLKPVPKKEAPDYLHFVKRPMDLFTIRDRVRKLKYRSRDDFRNDVRQIADNAHLYNDGRNPGIPPLADRLLELCDKELVARDDDLCEAEAGIELVHDDSFTCNSPTFDHRRRSVRMF